MSDFTPETAIQALREPGRVLNQHQCNEIAMCIGKLCKKLAAARQRQLLELASGAPAGTEFITWIPVADRLPDADLTVNIFCPDADDPVWLGFFDGSSWYSVDASRIEGVQAWAEMLLGPVVRATEERAHG